MFETVLQQPLVGFGIGVCVGVGLIALGMLALRPRARKAHTPRWARQRRRSKLRLYAGQWLVVAIIGVTVYAMSDVPGVDLGGDSGRSDSRHFACRQLRVIDGDTFDCGRRRIRLAGIDTPEMPGHCAPGRRCTQGDPFAARTALQRLVRQPVTCRQTDTDRYGRTVARCKAGEEDLSCAMLESGHAVRRYGYIACW